MVYYLGYYSCDQIKKEERKVSPPAINKMGYVISVLSEVVSEKTVVVSPSETTINKYVRGSMQRLDERVFMKTFDSFGNNNKIIRMMGHLLTKAQLFLYLMSKVKRCDTIIVYHSLALMGIVKKIKKAKKCNLIIEAEELYSDVRENDKLREKEIKYLQIADKYIVITELLNEQINKQNKPTIISHGTYKITPKYAEKNSDGKIHVVYAGTFNPIKGGANSAIEAAEFLDEKYVLHILGKGRTSDTNAVIKKIEQIAAKTKCKIIFEGYKTGKEFDAFMQSCHIGLSTQQPIGKYNASSFPSKILMYMSNGLKVVSVRIPAVDTSEVKDYISYFEDYAPESIANAIKMAFYEDEKSSSIKLDELNKKFSRELKLFLQ